MLRTALLGTAALMGLALAAPAFAQGSAPDAGPWNGFYAGLNVGYGGGHFNYPFSNTGAVTGSGTISQASTGVLGGVQAGYNYAVPSTGLVIGLETDFDGANINGSTSEALTTSATTTNGNLTSRINYLGTVRGRVGIPIMGGRLMPYVTGGFAYAGVNPLTGNLVNGVQSSNTVQTGWTVGGGAEMALKRNITVKVEYLHVALGDSPVYSATSSGGAVTAVSNISEQANANVIRVGLNYHF